MAKNKQLEQWQIDDASRLKALYNERVRISQTEFGSRYGIGSQGMVWQLLSATRPLNMATAAAFAQGIGVSIDDFSPTLARQVRDVRRHLRDEAKWPFQAIDESKVAELEPRMLAQLEAALLITAATLGIDVKKK